MTFRFINHCYAEEDYLGYHKCCGEGRQEDNQEAEAARQILARGRGSVGRPCGSQSGTAHPFERFAYLDLDPHPHLNSIVPEANRQAEIDGKLSKTASAAERMAWEMSLLGRIKYLKNEFEAQGRQPARN
jgi:hypothetical protein